MNMNNWIMNAYSEVYSTAMMQDVKSVAGAHRAGESRFSKIVKLLKRA
jgi:hypothetical protein